MAVWTGPDGKRRNTARVTDERLPDLRAGYGIPLPDRRVGVAQNQGWTIWPVHAASAVTAPPLSDRERSPISTPVSGLPIELPVVASQHRIVPRSGPGLRTREASMTPSRGRPTESDDRFCCDE